MEYNIREVNVKSVEIGRNAIEFVIKINVSVTRGSKVFNQHGEYLVKTLNAIINNAINEDIDNPELVLNMLRDMAKFIEVISNKLPNIIENYKQAEEFYITAASLIDNSVDLASTSSRIMDAAGYEMGESYDINKRAKQDNY